MLTARLRTLPEFSEHINNNAAVYEKIREIEEALIRDNAGKKEFTVKGYSYPAQAEVDFAVDFLYSDGNGVNWRERVICPITKLNNRLRASVHFLNFDLNPSVHSRIYIGEQLTPLYRYLETKYTNLIGSEYLGPKVKPGFIDPYGIRHEDATKLSFEEDELDFYLSFECFEHIPDFMGAFREAYRVLRPGGMMYWTVPFVCEQYDNMIRATMHENGRVEHHMEPDYHGDPVNPDQGILCYTYFGWQMFDQLRDIGFSDAYAITYWCDVLGYYNSRQFLFCAVK